MSVRTAVGAKADWAAGAGTTYANIPELRKWTLNPSTTLKEYASSSTAGKKKRIAGIDDFKGTGEFFVERSTSGVSLDTALGIKSGVSGSLKLWEDPTYFFIAPVFIDDVTYNVDIETGDIIGGTFNFSGNGAIVYPTV